MKPTKFMIRLKNSFFRLTVILLLVDISLRLDQITTEIPINSFERIFIVILFLTYLIIELFYTIEGVMI